MDKVDVSKKLLKILFKIIKLLIPTSLIGLIPIFVIIIVVSQISTSNKSSFNEKDVVLSDILTYEMIKEAVISQEKYDVLASITLAQIILESRGKYPLPNGKLSKLAYEDNNLFGMKGKGDLGYATHNTKEYTHNGDSYNTKASFAKYSSFKASIDAHGQLLAKEKYKGKVENKKDYKEWARVLTGVYATDPNYGSMLIKIIEDNGLDRFDTVNPSQISILLKDVAGVITSREDVNTPISARIVLSAKGFIDPYNNGYRNLCERFVRNVYERAGLKYESSHCAAFARDRFAKKDKNIPVGALIYSNHTYKSNVRCSACSRDAGHVAIYIGGGKIIGSQPKSEMSLDEFIRVYGYGGYSFNVNKV